MNDDSIYLIFDTLDWIPGDEEGRDGAVSWQDFLDFLLCMDGDFFQVAAPTWSLDDDEDAKNFQLRRGVKIEREAEVFDLQSCPHS